MESTFTEDDRIISSLSPAARSMRPRLVLKKAYMSRAVSATMAMSTYSTVAGLFRIVGLGTAYRDTLGAPCMMRRFTEYSAVMVRIPARSPWIFIFVCRNAVTQPHSRPATNAAARPRFGKPASVSIAAVHPPVTKEPSTVKSGESMTFTVMYSPKERTEKISPSSTARMITPVLIQLFLLLSGRQFFPSP